MLGGYSPPQLYQISHTMPFLLGSGGSQASSRRAVGVFASGAARAHT